MTEFQEALRSTKSSATGRGGTHYEMLNLHDTSTQEVVLYLFNQIWSFGCIPPKWKLGILIPL